MFIKLLSFFVVIVTAISTKGGRVVEPKTGNIAPQAKASASSSRPEFPIAGVNDNRMDTQWSATREKNTGGGALRSPGLPPELSRKTVVFQESAVKSKKLKIRAIPPLDVLHLSSCRI
jgi:hypothetical protein